VNHPTVYKVVYPSADYFAIKQHSEEYTFNGHSAVLTFWHRPLHAMTGAFTEAGFRISVVGEPPFSADAPSELLPPHLGDRTAFLCFIFFVLEASRAGIGTLPRRPLRSNSWTRSFHRSGMNT
jgi:hypothetical protein